MLPRGDSESGMVGALQFLQTSQKKSRLVIVRSIRHFLSTRSVDRSKFSAIIADPGFRDLCPGRGSADPYVSQT
jgi:hypothetical protein